MNKIQLCKPKISVMMVGSRTSKTSKMAIFVVIVKAWNLSKIVTISSVLDVAVVLDHV